MASSDSVHPSYILARLRRALRGEVDARTIALEAVRRGRASVRQRRERANLQRLNAQPARLKKEFAALSAPALLEHFRRRAAPRFFPGFDNLSATAAAQKTLFPLETAQLIERAARIIDAHRWPLLGYAEQDFGAEIEWRRDPLSGALWPLDYHAEVRLARGDGSDARVLWELNRLPHLLALGRAYAVTGDERLSEEFFAQLEDWRTQNPVGRGPNWACAMEVALRAMNLLAAFALFRHSPRLTAPRLMQLLAMFDGHGAHIRRNLEFSYISTSNHYLSDVTGLLWLGLMLPELQAAAKWRAFALREMLHEMDTQILSDGADCEASTGYHRFVLELLLYSFALCRANGVEIAESYRDKLRAMVAYTAAYLKPTGRAPLIGDTDGGQVLPLVPRAADDHAYLVALGAVIFQEPHFKLAARAAVPEELLWMLGTDGVRAYEVLPEDTEPSRSSAFRDAGTYVMRDDDLYLLFNASGNGLYGRGSHGHNDALSVEVSACGSDFVVDPGTYVYSSDLRERQLFRSVAYHSTVEVDGLEQNTTLEETPFVIGDEAHPRVLRWETGAERDLIVAEHVGYARLGEAVKHRRAVELDKSARVWFIEDALLGAGEHVFRFRFHLAHGLYVRVLEDDGVEVGDKLTGARLFLYLLEEGAPPQLEPRWTSRDYGAKMPSVSVCWTRRAHAPLLVRSALVPVCAGEDATARLEKVRQSMALGKCVSSGGASVPLA